MRVAVVSAPSQRGGIPGYVTALAKGIESMGHRVDVINAWDGEQAGFRLPAYEYIAVVSEVQSFFSGKIPEILSKLLAAGSVSGKKSAAFLRKGGLFAARAMANLMKVMEKEGMYINWSDTLLSAPHAEALGKRIGA